MKKLPLQLQTSMHFPSNVLLRFHDLTYGKVDYNELTNPNENQYAKLIMSRKMLFISRKVWSLSLKFVICCVRSNCLLFYRIRKASVRNFILSFSLMVTLVASEECSSFWFWGQSSATKALLKSLFNLEHSSIFILFWSSHLSGNSTLRPQIIFKIIEIPYNWFLSQNFVNDIGTACDKWCLFCFSVQKW